MTGGLDISLAPAWLTDGTPEERMTFGQFTIRAGNMSLSEGFDTYVDALRPGPLVSGYHAAEWFAWNWWRILHEPYSPRSKEWWRAHLMTAIGEGYLWPNISFRTDGIRAAVVARPSSNPEAKPFRFVSTSAWLGSASQLKEAIATFLSRMDHRLNDQGITSTNFQQVLADLDRERTDPTLSDRRRLEALLGRDPDDEDDHAVDALIADREALGAAGVDELAADTAGDIAPRAAALHAIAERGGLEARRADAVILSSTDLNNARAHDVAWQQGRHIAQALRRKESMGAAPVSTNRLASMLGASAPTDHKPYDKMPLSFVMNRDDGSARIVLRSRWDTGRRFELARLLGDQLLFGANAPFLPATRAYTFRQKAQRSFAAEFLCPSEVIVDMLRGDFSPEATEEVAEHFAVSTLTVETLLRNHGLIDRESWPDAA